MSASGLFIETLKEHTLITIGSTSASTDAPSSDTAVITADVNARPFMIASYAYKLKVAERSGALRSVFDVDDIAAKTSRSQDASS